MISKGIVCVLFLAVVYYIAFPQPQSLLERVTINSSPHWVLIHESPNPQAQVLLMLHGGPGASEMPYFDQLAVSLEDQYIVVTYDQRGAGKTCAQYSNYSDAGKMTVAEHVDDVLELTEYLLQRFSKDKLYLLGGSWGSMLGLLSVQARPELFAGFIARGLFVHGRRNEEISRDYVLHNSLGIVPPAMNLPYEGRVEELLEQRKALYSVGGNKYACKDGCWPIMMTIGVGVRVVRTPYYSWGDIVAFKPCMMDTLRSMWYELESFDAFSQVPSLDVPFYLFHGTHDYNTPWELAQEYYNKVQAPSKKVYWFDKSSHSPDKEEPVKFARILNSIVSSVQE